MPQMPDIAGGYAKIGEQVAGVGKQLGGAITDYANFFATREGKKKLIDEIKAKYPTVVQAYPEDVLMQMENKELGQRLAAVVGIENAIQKLKEIDPKFSTADIEQMKAEIFKQPDQARTIAKDWMAIAEKNRQDSVNKESLAMVGGQPAQPAMPQVSAPQAPISDAELGRETADLLDPTKTVMPSQTSQSDLGQQLSAVDAERTPVMPAVSQKPRTRERIYGDLSASGKIPDKATQEIIDKASRSEKDINAEDTKLETLKQKQEAAAAAILRRAKEHQDRMALGNRNAKATEDLVALTAIQKVTDISKDQIDAEVKAGEAEQTAAALEPGDLRDAYVRSAIELRQKAGIMSPNLTVAQGIASGIVKTAETRNPKIAEAVENQKLSKEQEEAIKAYDSEVKGTSRPKYSEIDPKQQSEALKKIVALYRKSKKK